MDLSYSDQKSARSQCNHHSIEIIENRFPFSQISVEKNNEMQENWNKAQHLDNTVTLTSQTDCFCVQKQIYYSAAKKETFVKSLLWLIYFFKVRARIF